MHLLDPNAVMNLTASILTLAAAAIPFLKSRRLHNRQSNGSKSTAFLKKSESRRRPVEISRLLHSLEAAKVGVDMIFSCIDNDHIEPSNLNRYFGYYI